MGKIIGLALVGLTQFLVWVVLTFAIVTAVKTAIVPEKAIAEAVQSLPRDVMSQGTIPQNQPESVITAGSGASAEFVKIFNTALNQPWGLIIFSFIFYFISGYLLYASVFAAVGSAVDSETETQQFMFPIVLPVVLGLIVAMSTMQNPESSIAFWFSIIPLTSPIVMMARIPFGVPGWEIALSMFLMAVTFVIFVWMAAKIYRTGILMYGKKTSWKEMWKWLTYKG